MQDEKTYPFDVFISYRWISPDREWVRNQLCPALREAGLRVCLDVEDFVRGRDLILETERAGLESRRTLCVISPEYFEQGRMVEFESLSAQRRDPSGRNSLLIPLIVRETEIPERMRGPIPIIWTDPTDHPREWKKLLQILEAPNPNSEPPTSLNHRIERPFQSTAKRHGISRWRWRNNICVAAALVILTLGILTITQVLSGKSDTIDVDQASSPASPQPTTTPSPSTTPAPGPSPSAPVRPMRTRPPSPQRNPETRCPPKDRLIGKC
jgi:hypothetical protein